MEQARTTFLLIFPFGARSEGKDDATGRAANRKGLRLLVTCAAAAAVIHR